MTTQSPRPSDDVELFSLIKQMSGRRIERRRRRDHVSQSRLAEAVGRSVRWLREIEAGIATSILEDHLRCAHSLGMTTAHIFIPLLAVEYNMPIPRELLMMDDLWEVEQAWIEVLSLHHTRAQSRKALQFSSPDPLGPK